METNANILALLVTLELTYQMHALKGVAIAIKKALSPDSQRGLSKHAFSPRKAVDMRSKYIQQSKDLMSLHEMGGLTTEEYEEERCTIVRQMRKLQRDE